MVQGHCILGLVTFRVSDLVSLVSGKIIGKLVIIIPNRDRPSRSPGKVKQGETSGPVHQPFKIQGFVQAL